MTDNQQHTKEKVQNILLYCDKYSIDLNLNYQTN